MPSPPTRAICFKKKTKNKKKKLVKNSNEKITDSQKKIVDTCEFRCTTFPILKNREKKGGGRDGYNFFPYVFLDPS